MDGNPYKEIKDLEVPLCNDEDLSSLEWLENESEKDDLTPTFYGEKIITSGGYSDPYYREGVLEGEAFCEKSFFSTNERTKDIEERIKFKWGLGDTEFCLGYSSVVFRGIIFNVLKQRIFPEMRLDAEEIFVHVELAIYKAINSWISKGDPQKHIFGFVKNILNSDFEEFLKPVAGTHYQRKKYAQNSLKENPEHVLGGFGRKLFYPSRFDFDDEDKNKEQELKNGFENLSESVSEDDFSKFTSLELVKEVRLMMSKRKPESLKKLDVLLKVLAESKNESGVLLKYARGMREDHEHVSNNTLTKWAKYDIEKKLQPEIRSIMQNFKVKEEK